MLTRNKNIVDKSVAKTATAKNPEHDDDKFAILLHQISEINLNISEIKLSMGGINDRITALSNGLDFLTKQCDQNSDDILKVNYSTDSIEQYTRRNNLRFLAIPENDSENTDDIIIELVKNKFGISLNVTDIERSHRLGKMREGANTKPRPIIVKFLSYRVREAIFTKKRVLKGSRISISEDLTRLRAQLLRKAQDTFGKRNVWTSDGKFIWVKTVHGKSVKYSKNVDELSAILSDATP